ncbi:MAG: helix-turn-helix domain-containing protein, partial [Planctomycetota bacterium]
EGDVIQVCDIGFIGYKDDFSSEKSESLHGAVKAYEKQYIYKVLNKYDWDKTEAAKALGVGLSSLYRKVDELGINVKKNRKN